MRPTPTPARLVVALSVWGLPALAGVAAHAGLVDPSTAGLGSLAVVSALAVAAAASAPAPSPETARSPVEP